MAVRWHIRFKTLSEHDGLVKVYDSTYNGDAIDLTPAANTLSLTRSMKDVCTPVANDSGYLRIIDNGLLSEDIKDISPVGGLDRPVEFYLDGNLEWRGYISPESYSTPLEGYPCELSFPLVGALQALAGVTMEDNGVGRQPIAAFLVEILTATGFSWAGVRYAEQMSPLAASLRFTEARLSLSRFNFIRANNSDNIDNPDWTPLVGDSYLTCLEEICRFFGWTAYTYQDILVLDTLRRDVTTLKSVTWSQLGDLAGYDMHTLPQTAGIEREEIDVDDLTWDGYQHRKSVSAGAYKVVVSANASNDQDIYPNISYKGRHLITWPGDFVRPNTSDNIRSRVIWLDPALERLRLHSYRIIMGNLTEVSWRVPQDEYELKYPAGAIVLADTWTRDEEGDKVNYSYKEYIRLSCTDPDFVHVSADIPLVEITSRQIGVFGAGGALCLSGVVRSSYARFSTLQGQANVIEDDGLSQWGPYNNDIRMSLSIGGKWWNGQTWGDTEVIFGVTANMGQAYDWDNPDAAEGRIINTKTLNMPYNGAFGWIIPIDANMEGLMTVKFYPWIKNTPQGWDPQPVDSDFTSLYIADFGIRYYADDEIFEDSELRLVRLAGDKFRDVRDVNLRMSSAPDRKVGLGTMWLLGDRVWGLNYVDGGTYLPEQWLLDTYVRCCSHPLVTMELQVAEPLPLLPWDSLDYNGRLWAVTGYVTEYADEHTRLTIVSYE